MKGQTKRNPDGTWAKGNKGFPQFWFKKGSIPKSAIKKGEHRSLATEWKKGQLNLYPTPKGTHLSPASEFKKGHHCYWKGRKKPEASGEKHPLWKGDSVGYHALHNWVERKLGSPKKCMKCKTHSSSRFVWHNISGKYKRDLKDWERLCIQCHNRHHQLGKRRK